MAAVNDVVKSAESTIQGAGQVLSGNKPLVVEHTISNQISTTLYVILAGVALIVVLAKVLK